ncbi:endothelin-1 isoform X1 [Thalassophryne amazonica]|uniref:endothelin-1 isoform X1 n=1 Tax=Thalassophryne amazonica TaxID=390379 RepID=UPI001471B67F|nr:endothelin-1 isoform X1 [Thalassophryne amazonica]
MVNHVLEQQFVLRESRKMDLHVWFAALSLIYSGIACAAPAAPTPSTPGRHVRTKRCSCATFLDKECVYFCHLDIIWVNTPERVVSYGLGSAPRMRRALSDSRSAPRCRCLHENDSACTKFCQMGNHVRYETSETVERDGRAETSRKHKLAADTSWIRRVKSSKKKGAPALATRTRLLLKKWRVRQRRRTRSWKSDSSAS